MADRPGPKLFTVESHILAMQRLHPSASGEFTSLLNDIALAAKIISNQVNQAGLVDILGTTGTENIQGEKVQKLDEASERLRGAMRVFLEGEKERLARMARLFESLSPLAVLKRGYSITTREVTGEVVFRAREVSPGEDLKIRFSEGSVTCEVSEVEEG